jgi:hypothetical protein
LNFGKDFKVLRRFIQNPSNPPTCWDHGLYGNEPQSFPPNLSPKKRESQQLFYGLRLVRRIFEENLTFRNPNQNSATLWRIFSLNKSAPANRKKGFYTTVILTSRRLDSFLYEAAQNFEVFSNIQK